MMLIVPVGIKCLWFRIVVRVIVKGKARYRHYSAFFYLDIIVCDIFVAFSLNSEREIELILKGVA